MWFLPVGRNRIAAPNSLIHASFVEHPKSAYEKRLREAGHPSRRTEWQKPYVRSIQMGKVRSGFLYPRTLLRRKPLTYMVFVIFVDIPYLLVDGGKGIENSTL